MLKFVCRELGVSIDDIWGKGKNKNLLAKRWIVICFLYLAGLNFSEIGRKVQKDHQTVIHALDNANKDMWYVAGELICKYVALRQIPNYKNSKIEEV